MRGGLDDALDKMARLDELRRRAAGETTGTPPAVTELVEAVAAVVGRHHQLGVTVGVEGAGDPMLLHFYFDNGQVQVNAESAVAARTEPPAATPRPADFEVEVEVEDEPDRYYAESDTAERSYGGFDHPIHDDNRSRDLGARMRDLGMASTSNGGQPHPPPSFPTSPTPQPTYAEAAPTQPTYAEAAPTQPIYTESPPAQPVPTGSVFDQPTSAQPVFGQPIPGQTIPGQPIPAQPIPAQPISVQTAYAEPAASHPMYAQPASQPTTADRIPKQAAPPPPERSRKATPLPHPIPLQVERPEETEMAARRLAAMLRDDPTLLSQPPD